MNNERKEYDYWLVIWKYRHAGELHDPIPFQKGGDPQSWAKSMFEIRCNKNGHNQNGSFDELLSYELIKLEIA